jgi:hypothetical protein
MRDPPAVAEPSPLRRDFKSLTAARRLLADRPDVRVRGHEYVAITGHQPADALLAWRRAGKR